MSWIGELTSFTFKCNCGCIATFDRHRTKKIKRISRQFTYEGDETEDE